MSKNGYQEVAIGKPVDPIDVTYEPGSKSSTNERGSKTKLYDTLQENSESDLASSNNQEYLMGLRGTWTFIIMFALLQTAIGF